MLSSSDEPVDAPAVLLVDDDVDLLFTMKALLASVDLPTLEATNIEDAMALIDSNRVGLVVSDVQMPGGTGLDLLRNLRRKKICLPVIIQTGQPQVEAAVECIKLGANDYLRKPIDTDLLLKKIRQNLAAADQQATAKINKTSIKPDVNGRILGGYQIIDTLGEGQIGVVFLAGKPELEPEKRFALKILKTASLSGINIETFLTRFKHEARAAARIKHENIVRLVEYGVDIAEHIPYIVMEYVAGQPLTSLFKQSGTVDLELKIAIIRQIAKALSAIHSIGIVHRDVKPDNILVAADNVIKLTDFGIAKIPESELTVTSMVMGTPNYMSPEGFESALVDNRSDIFSLGVLSYEFFTGRKPFAADNIALLAHHIRTKPPPAPAAAIPGFPSDLQAILARMLKKDKSERYADAADIVGDLNAYQHDRGAEFRDRLRDYVSERDWS